MRQHRRGITGTTADNEHLIGRGQVSRLKEFAEHDRPQQSPAVAEAHFPIAHDIQPAIFPRALFQDLLAGGDPLHADASRHFLQLAFVDFALEVEQVADQAAR